MEWPKYCIILGCRKSGTTALEKYLQDKTIVCIREECIWTSEGGPEYYNKLYKDLTPIVILRNPIDRAVSAWKYAIKRRRISRDMTFEEYIIHTQGTNADVIKQSNYEYWRKKWSSINILYVYLEDMKDIMKKENVS